MGAVVQNLGRNLQAGMRLLRFHPVEPDEFRIGLDPLISLLLLDLLLQFVTDLLASLPAPAFYGWGSTYYSLSLLSFLFAAYLASRLIRRNEQLLPLLVMLFAATPFFLLISLLQGWVGQELGTLVGWGYSLSAWFFFLLVLLLPARALFLLNERRWRPALTGLLPFLLLWLPVAMVVNDYNEFWYFDPPEEERPDPYAAYRNIDAEALLYAQPQRLGQALATLAPQRPGVSDLYFVSFAGYAHQDVFAREVGYARALMDRKFGTRGRSLTLVNSLQARNTLPLASATNLEQALKRLGEIIDPEEDVVALYLTSHGARNQLAVEFWPLPLNDITPQRLRAMFDAAGIKWRIVMVSACYSGSFIQALQDERTIIATAAAHNRKSFGCSNEREFTYFGEALFKQQLSHEHSFIRAFEQTQLAIGERERSEELTPSLPQLFIGSAIRPKLESLAERLDSCSGGVAGRSGEWTGEC